MIKKYYQKFEENLSTPHSGRLREIRDFDLSDT